ncbi:hypothetical protein [Streptomyces sp. NPDC127084]|uniref:hypothetical protein n=1 Tax=Streptomyces sp. NPDC127084 TaxID=3347133 RepID=UPI003667CAF8
MWVAATVTLIAFGVAGCGAGDAGTGAASPRPEGTGPITKEVVRADIDTSLADVGLPTKEPEYVRLFENAAAGSPQSCSVDAKAFGSETAPVDIARYEALVGELRERAWQQSGERTEDKGRDGEALRAARVVLKQRGWSMRAEYRSSKSSGIVTVLALDDACMKQNGASMGSIG